MKNAYELWQAHRHLEAIAECRRRLAVDPEDFAAVGTLSRALLAARAYQEALLAMERFGADERQCKVAPGQSGRQLEIACLHWLMGHQLTAIMLMRGAVHGILDDSIKYGDAAGGVEQGLLLYYMGLTANDPDSVPFAIKYLRNRAKRAAIHVWPGPLARYCLGDLGFEEVLAAATGQRNLSDAINIARTDLLKRRQLVGALFHDGVKKREDGAEEQCMARMQECYALEDPLIELEWYLARHEMEQASAGAALKASK
jgi:hypothetical protein